MYAEYRAVQDVRRPKGDWHKVEIEVRDQAQVDDIVDWIENAAKGGVDIFVVTNEASPRGWRLGCYGWSEAMPVTSDSKAVDPLTFRAGDMLRVYFEDANQAVLFKLTWK